MAGRVVHVAMHEKVLTHDPTERVKNMRLMYSIRGTINPTSGEMHGPNSLGLIREVFRAFDEGAKRSCCLGSRGNPVIADRWVKVPPQFFLRRKNHI
jgi:hypothetical protein